MGRSPRFSATRVTPAIARAVREWPGWFAAAAGAVLCVLGWYGVSGQSVVEQQVPYLASATLPGVALIVAGAVLVAARPARRAERADRRIEQLYALLVVDADADPGAADGPDRGTAAGTAPGEGSPEDAALLTVPEGTFYHRRDCPLVAGKSAATPVDADVVRDRSLTPCPVCEPPAPPAGEAG